MKGVEIKFFTLCTVFRRFLSFIYQKFYLSDRVPLRCFNGAPDMIKLKGRCYPNIYDVLPGNLRIATNLAMTLRYLSIAFIYVGQNTNKNSFR